VERFAAAFAAIRRHVETRYGVACGYAPIPAGFYGDLNGAEIRLKPGLGAEDELFMLLHLFGHTVQWNLRGVLDLDLDPAAGPPAEAAVAAVLDYEREACAYSLQLLLDTGFGDLQPWLSDMSAADLRHLLHFYATGESLGARHFWRAGEPPIAPRAIPAFTPKVLRWRWEGIVV
jgi:hypothetical protein